MYFTAQIIKPLFLRNILYTMIIFQGPTGANGANGDIGPTGPKVSSSFFIKLFALVSKL